MGRGTSKAGGGSNGGASGGQTSGKGLMNSQNALSLLDMVKRSVEDPMVGYSTIYNLMNNAQVGTKFRLKTSQGWIEEYIKKSKDKWIVKMSPLAKDVAKVKSSAGSLTAAVEQVVKTLYNMV